MHNSWKNLLDIIDTGRTEYQSMEEMRRRARVERTFQRHGSRGSRATITGTCSSSRAHTPSNVTTASPDLTSRIFSRSRTWYRKWLPRKRSTVSTVTFASAKHKNSSPKPKSTSPSSAISDPTTKSPLSSPSPHDNSNDSNQRSAVFTACLISLNFPSNYALELLTLKDKFYLG
ncbi:hypothetical protein Tcan_15818 [Toxocara canis]|uniref:Uncharacterized protein n=1 Tax=Toxocara canis TaxID=6265 RepID=A0A0B2UXQ3_TOXCA|nr:hypothetical protein Tcan_15818 [Toxocara canis]